MAAVDFITALGRLLHSGTLRDAFAVDAVAFMREIGLGESHRPSFGRLVPADLEHQARVLLRKRFELVRDALPQTCHSLGQLGWEEFQRYGRPGAPGGKNPAARDALAFAEYLAKAGSHALSPVEFNRARFACESHWLAIHFVRIAPVARTRRPCVQVLFRHRSWRRHEWLIYMGR